jgi:hypothetical protein
MARRLLAALALPLALSACVAGGPMGQAAEPRAELSTSGIVPPMRWDHHPEAATWTETAFAALETHGAALPGLTPADIEAWCPAYPEASPPERKAFWTGLISTLAKHESTWNPAAVGGGGRWFGLVQIAPATARGYGCEARTGEALKDGTANLSTAESEAASPAIVGARSGAKPRGRCDRRLRGGASGGDILGTMKELRSASAGPVARTGAPPSSVRRGRQRSKCGAQ